MQQTGEGTEMELESRPHRSLSINSSASNNATSELFICFASRLSSSSSMKLSSAKSILSPSRPRDAPQISLSSSLSRRLRTNGSMKGGQASPMFPTGGKKRGCAFENPEPSSPKVTCIGQVRVKTKKQGKKLRPNRRRHLSGGEASFRKVEVGTAGLQRLGRQDSNLMSSQLQASDYYGEECVAGRNQRRGHFPEALRAFGAEWNCFVPCGSSCSTKEEEKGRAGGENKEGSHGGGSCGAVIARWLVALQEGPEGKGRGRKIELVVGDDEQVDDRSGSYHRRRAFEGIEFDERGVRGFEGKEGEEERGRVSICVPPKNALLLMRCRSDPVKMAALVSKFCDTPVQSDEVDEEDAEEVLGKICGIRDLDAIRRCREEEETREQLTVVRAESVGNTGEAIKGEGQCTTVEEHAEEDEEGVEVNLLAKELHELISSKIEEEIAMDEATREAGVSRGFMPSDGERSERGERDGAGNGAEERDGDDEVLYECEELNCVLSVHFLSESEENDKAELKEAEAEVLCLSDEKGTFESEEVEQSETEDRREDDTQFRPDLRIQEKLEFEVKREAPVLPDCLLLMMCEPKLSMEVSKETWVCRNDFLRWLPERSPVANRISSKVDDRDDFKKKTRHHNPSATSTTTTTTATALTSHHERILQQPPRNSCSFPIKTSDLGAAESMATLIEQRLVSAKACDPLVLTRCKSEPMRAAIRLAPDACFGNRKINPHQRRPVVSNIVKAAKLMV